MWSVAPAWLPLPFSHTVPAAAAAGAVSGEQQSSGRRPSKLAMFMAEGVGGFVLLAQQCQWDSLCSSGGDVALVLLWWRAGERGMYGRCPRSLASMWPM